MDNRASFVGLFLDNVHSIYYDADVLDGVEWMFQCWNEQGYNVDVWRDSREEFLFFYRSRYLSRYIDTADATEYFVVPSFNNPRWVILNDGGVIANHGPIIKPTSLKARLVWGVAKLLNKFGLFSMVFPDRLVANKVRLAGRVYSNVGSNSTILYTGAVGEYQKFTIQYCNSDRSINYLKLSNTKKGTERIVAEYRALNCFKDVELEYVDVPSAVEKIRCGGFQGFVQTNILSNEEVTPNLVGLDVLAISNLYNYFGIEKRYILEYLKEIGFYDNETKLSFLNDYFNAFNDKYIYVSCSHGDYLPWNRFVSSGKIKIIDWETYGCRTIFYDVCYFIAHKVILVENKQGLNIVKESASCIDELLPRVNGLSAHDFDVKLYILLSLIEMYLHYKKNEHDADKNILYNILNAISELRIDGVEIN